MAERNSYIVTKALNSYLKGSVIIAISGHFVTTTDAVVVSWIIGSKAFTAVNVIIPVLTLFSSLMIMLSTGASISISRALGNRNKEEVNLSFSSSLVGAVIIGAVAGIITYWFAPEIVSVLVHGDDSLFRYATSYLKSFCFAIPVLIIVGVVANVVRTDGNTPLVSLAVWIGIINNVILDILFVGFLGMGIAGAGWATAINYFLALIICLFHFASKNNTIGWSSRVKEYFSRILKNCRLGFSTSLADFLLAVSLFVINIIMLHYQGSEGIYCWAVCYQVFLILQMLLSGVDASFFSLGGTLLGEDDATGLNYLYRRSVVYLIIGVVLLTASIIIFPEFFGMVFGNTGDDRLDLLPSVLKVFSFFLFPYAMVMQVRAVFTILGRGSLSLFLCVTIFALMILGVFIFSWLSINPIWWSFPLVSWLLLISLGIYTLIIHLKNKNLRWFSLIPKRVTDPSYSTSISLNDEDLKTVEQNMEDFLKKQSVDETEISDSVSVTSEIMESILKDLLKSNKKKRFFDLSVRIKAGKIVVILKDDGERIDRKQELELVEGASNNHDFTAVYFYMNKQNTLTLTFQ